MAQFVNMPELDELGQKMHKYAENEIRGEIDRLLSLYKKYSWYGVGSNAYFDQYRKIMNYLYDYSDMVEKFGYFLRYVSEGYDNVREESKDKFMKYIEEKEENDKSYLWREG